MPCSDTGNDLRNVQLLELGSGLLSTSRLAPWHRLAQPQMLPYPGRETLDSRAMLAPALEAELPGCVCQLNLWRLVSPTHDYFLICFIWFYFEVLF